MDPLQRLKEFEPFITFVLYPTLAIFATLSLYVIAVSLERITKK